MMHPDFSVNEFYHVYNRGTDKRKIFLSLPDYQRFMVLLFLANSNKPVHIDLRRNSLEELFETDRETELVDIGAYCLMPNHFHLLLKEKIENGISFFMQKLTTAYTMYFNKKHDRTGALLQGTFKAEHLADDNYLRYIYSYVHLNPVKLIDPTWRKRGIRDKRKVKNFLENYKYSSYQDYVGIDRQEKVILDKSAFPLYFERTADFEEMIEFWLSFKEDY